MTLRLRLFALLAALAVLLALGEWALVRKLSADLEGELTTAAAAVGRDMLRVLRFEGKPPDDLVEAGQRLLEHRVIVRRPGGPAATERAGETPADAAPAAPDAPPSTPRAALPSPIADWLAGDDVQLRVDENSPPRVLLLHGTVERRLEVPTSGVEDAVGRFGRRLLLASLAMVAAAVLLAGAVIHRFTQPLRDLAAAARRLGEGDLGLRAPAAPGEVGEAIAAFNQMSQRLAELDAEARRLRGSEQLSELGEVGRGLAHSLRNPLNALGLALDQLAERAADDEANDVAAAARRQIGRIDGALRGFLALATGGATSGEVDVLAVARDVALEALQAQPAGSPGAPAVAVEVRAPAEPLRVSGVEAEVRAALQALVVNAVEASPPGAEVVVTLGPADGAVVATVDDSGPGLAPEVRARLFTPHLTTKAAGAGVGLYLAHRLATDRYGGDLELTDRPEGGTRATLRLRDRRGSVVPRGAAAPASPEAAVGG